MDRYKNPAARIQYSTFRLERQFKGNTEQIFLKFLITFHKIDINEK